MLHQHVQSALYNNTTALAVHELAPKLPSVATAGIPTTPCLQCKCKHGRFGLEKTVAMLSMLLPNSMILKDPTLMRKSRMIVSLLLALLRDSAFNSERKMTVVLART